MSTGQTVGNGRMQAPKRPISPSILSDTTRRLVVPFRTITQKGTYAPCAIFFGRDTIDVLPVTEDFVDRFLIYNAHASRREEIIESAVREIYGDGFIDIAERIMDVYRGVDTLMRYLNGSTPLVDYVYGAWLIENVHYVKTIIRGGGGLGAVKIMIQPMTSYFIPYIVPVSIYDLVLFYYTQYKRYGRPRFAESRDRDIISTLRKLKTTDVDTAIDYAVFYLLGQSVYSFKTFVIFLNREKRAVMVDAKRLINMPSLERLEKVVAIQSGSTGIVIFILDMPIEEIVKHIQLIDMDMVRRYQETRGTGGGQELLVIEQKATIQIYGKYIKLEDESVKKDLDSLFLGTEEEEEEESSSPTQSQVASPTRVETPSVERRTTEQVTATSRVGSPARQEGQREEDLIGGETF